MSLLEFTGALTPVPRVFVVEVKSHLRSDGLEAMRRKLAQFRTFFPEHADKEVFGSLAAVDAPRELQEQVLREGIHLAKSHDGQFELQVPAGFHAKSY